MSKPDKAVIALLAAQLDVMLALVGRQTGGGAIPGRLAKQLAAAGKVAEQFRQAPKKKSLPKKAKRR